jgi:hypothetical protein
LYCLSGVSGKSIAKFIAACEIAEAGTKALADDEVVSLGFTSLRDTPSVFKHAAASHPSDPDCWPLTAVMLAVAVLAGKETRSRNQSQVGLSLKRRLFNDFISKNPLRRVSFLQRPAVGG